MAAGHEPDDRVGILGDLLVEREVAIDAHDDDGKVVFLLDRGEGLVNLAEELSMRLVPTADRLIPCPPGSRDAPPGPLWIIGNGLSVISVKTLVVASNSRVGFSVRTRTR